ncbi:MAG: response regulator transcription factor [Moorea sp. SIO2B7]|nr:response regulator transcription factor [Moorena sp. SIO2B7]
MIPQEMLEHLIKQVAAFAPSKVLQRTEKTVDEIILESDIDGTAYYLVRRTPRVNCEIHLSPREKAIAKLVAQGLSNKSIGKRLGIAHWTVATHLRRIFVKLNVNSRTAMITRLLEENVLQG